MTEIVVDNSRSSAWRGVRTAAVSLISPIVAPTIAPDVTINELIDPAVRCCRKSATAICASTTAAVICRCILRHTGLLAPYQALNDPSMQASMGIFCTPEQVQQQWEDCMDRPGRIRPVPDPSLHDPSLAPAGKQVAPAFAMWF